MAHRSPRFDPEPTESEKQQQQLSRIEAALTALLDTLSDLSQRPQPAPEVNVAPAQVNAEVPVEPLVQAITRIEQALAAIERPGDVLPPTIEIPPIDMTGAVDLSPLHGEFEAMRQSLDAVKEKIANVIRGPRSHFDGRLRSDTGVINPATEETLLNVSNALGGEAQETRLDYGARTDANPVYVGTAPQGSGTDGALWDVQKLEYDASSRLTRKQKIEDAVWDDRASLAWT